MTPTQNVWLAALQANPDHARNYADRWRRLEAQGRDIHGEARLVDAMVERGSRILDAGCGTGRIGGWLADRGHRVTGVDLDEHLISVARADHPNADWRVANLATFSVDDETGDLAEFDLIVCAGNVVTFFAEAERLPALERIRAHLAPAGRFLVGFGAGRGYDFERFVGDAFTAGLVLQQHWSTWQLDPPSSDFLVAAFTRASTPAEVDE